MVLEFECFTVPANVGKVPGDHVACMDAPELLGLKLLREGAGIKVIHVLVNPDIRRDEGIDEQEVKVV